MMMRYRQYLTDVGESLFRVSDPFDMLERSHQLSIDLGVGRVETWMSTPVSIPIPLHDPNRGLALSDVVSPTVVAPGFPMRWPDGRDVPRWPAANPHMLWNPLLWLPDHLAAPVDVVYDGGVTVREDMTSWSVRVALELHAVGLYDVNAGWLDVLALVGIDTETEAGVSRVSAWLRGAPDPVLDVFSLDSFFEDAPGWSLQESYDFASRMAPVLVRANLALAADRLLEYVDDVDDSDWALFVSELDAISLLWLPAWSVTGRERGRDAEVLRELATAQFNDHVAMLELVDSVADGVVSTFGSDVVAGDAGEGRVVDFSGVAAGSDAVNVSSPLSPSGAELSSLPVPPPLGGGWG